MENLLLSCIESRVESDRSFYGRFQLGPFEKGQGLTVATALRRSLLSELTGLAITAVKIDGVSHEYSTIKGVRESVVNILLNLKQIVLTSEFELQEPQIGYLNIKGPGIVTSNDLKLPLSVQCVDSKQYIATLSHGSILKMKFLISHGKNYTNQNPDDINAALFHPGFDSSYENFSSFVSSGFGCFGCEAKHPKHPKHATKADKAKSKIGEGLSLRETKNENQTSSENYFQLGSLKQDGLLESKKQKKLLNFNKFKTYGSDGSELESKKNQLNGLPMDKEENLVFSGNKKKEDHASSTEGKPFLSLNNQFSYKQKQTFLENFNNKELNSFKTVKKEKNKNILSVDAVFMPVNRVNFLLELDDDVFLPADNDKTKNKNNFSLNYGSEGENTEKRKTSLKERIILEIWTNGSIHPRQAIHEAAKSLIKLFFPFQETRFLKALFFTSNKLPKKIFNNLEEKLKISSKNENLFLEKKRFSIDIGNLDLSLRPYTCLKRANINTVGELLEYSSQELLLLKNFGKRSLEEVEKNLAQIGLNLRYQEDKTSSYLRSP